MKRILLFIIFLSTSLFFFTCKKKKTEPTPSSISVSSGSLLKFKGTSYPFTTTGFTSGNDFVMSGVCNKFSNASIVILFPNGTPTAGFYPINSTNSNDVSMQFTDSTGTLWYADANTVALNVSSNGSSVIASFANVIFTQYLYDSITTKASGIISE